MMVLKIKKLSETAKLPTYAKESDAGMDLYADETVIIQPGERKTVALGIAMEIPKGHVGLIWDKSGVALNGGLKTMGGVADAGYRGEIKVIVHNLSAEPYTVEKGKKVAQMLIQEVKQKKILEVDELSNSDRGEGGFGSTGLN